MLTIPYTTERQTKIKVLNLALGSVPEDEKKLTIEESTNITVVITRIKIMVDSFGQSKPL